MLNKTREKLQIPDMGIFEEQIFCHFAIYLLKSCEKTQRKTKYKTKC